MKSTRKSSSIPSSEVRDTMPQPEGCARPVRWLAQERGFTMLEVIIALGILGFVGVAFLAAVGTSSRSTSILDEAARSEVLARQQIDEIKGLSYATSYPTPTPGGLPAGYAISITTTTKDDTNCAAEYLTPGPDSCNTLQEVTVSVTLGVCPRNNVINDIRH